MNNPSHHKTPRWAYIAALLLLATLTYLQSHFFAASDAQLDSTQSSQHSVH
jgi:hypothetical protein